MKIHVYFTIFFYKNQLYFIKILVSALQFSKKFIIAIFSQNIARRHNPGFDLQIAIYQVLAKVIFSITEL